MTQFYHYVPHWLLSRPFDLIFSLCTPLTPFKTIWPDFIILYTIDSFQDHLTAFYHCVPYWLLSRPFNPVLSLCTLLTPFKTICPNFIIEYPIDSFQDHLTRFYHSVPNWFLSRPFAPVLSLCTLLTSWKESVGYTMQKPGYMVLKGVIWVHNDQTWWNRFQRTQ